MRIGRSSRSWSGLAGLWLLASATGALAQTAPAAPELPRIDMQLFDKAEVDRSKGCSFALWQANRDPEKDRYSHIFIESIGRNSVRDNARVKIGRDVLTFRRVAVGGAQEYGNKTFPTALYKAEKDDSYLIFNLKLDTGPGEVLEVQSGTMTVIRPGFVPFVAQVKGDIACNMEPPKPASATAPPRAAAPSPPPASSDPALQSYPVAGKDVPARLRAEAVKAMGCKDATLRKGGTAYSLSEEAAIWELPCDDFVSGPGKIMMLVYTPDPSQNYTFLSFPMPKGQDRHLGARIIVNPRWDLRSRVMTSIVTEGNGRDCGVYERHRLNAEGKFELIEYREKTLCDGKSMDPKDFPVVFRR